MVKSIFRAYPLGAENVNYSLIIKKVPDKYQSDTTVNSLLIMMEDWWVVIQRSQEIL
jgi:hypothetical protein